MNNDAKITNTNDECDFKTFLSGDKFYVVPYFQRAYKWNATQHKELEEDFLLLLDGDDSHFLGSIITNRRNTNPSDASRFDVIDGQQRLTTIFVYLIALARTYADSSKNTEKAKQIMLGYAILGDHVPVQAGESRYKLHPGKSDRAQMNKVMRDVIEHRSMRDTGLVVSPLASTVDIEKGAIANAFRRALKFFKSEFQQGEEKRLDDLYEAIISRLTVVQVDIKDPLSGPKVFRCINGAQEPMTAGDLVKNDIFARIEGQDISEIEEVERNSWAPFFERFGNPKDGLFEKYLFPYGLIQQPSVQKSKLYPTMRKSWTADMKPQEIISSLEKYQTAFLDLMNGDNQYDFDSDCHLRITRLLDMKYPMSALPFLMQIVHALHTQSITPIGFCGAIDAVESFLVRRAVNQLEPTGLHAVFKFLWNDCEGDYTPENIHSIISSKPTVEWPSNKTFEADMMSRNLYGSSITKYLLIEFDKDAGGDFPNLDVQIEHILPQKPDKRWFDDWSEDEHMECLNKVANLLPVTQPMNNDLSNAPYQEKRPIYKDDSAFKSVRDFASEYTVWTPDQMLKRSESMAKWALERWPI